MNDPSTTDSEPFVSADARDAKGRFGKGNPGGPGNPGIGQLSKYRARFSEALKTEDIDLALTVIREVMAEAKDADRLQAAKQLLDRVLGLPVSGDVEARPAALEQLLASRSGESK